jgi:hypothetical protein
MSTVSRLSRRSFFVTSLASAGALAIPGALVLAADPPKPAAVADSARSSKPKPPPLPDDLVREFVVAAHGNLDRTRELLGNEPGLLNATWDWKAGDFEMAIGGAGHMGRRDIAGYLIEQGARMDLFVAAMLGELQIVQAFLTAYPALARSKGPHGIPLIAHARAGGEPAREVLAYLEGIERK